MAPQAAVNATTPTSDLTAPDRRQDLWATVFEASSEGIVLLDADGRVLSANRTICKACGCDAADMVDQRLDFVLVGGTPAAQAQGIWDTAGRRGRWRGEVLVTRRNGRSFPARAVLTVVRDGAGRLAHYILSCRDITDRKASGERIKFLAHHDTLTGLPNRSAAERRLREAIEQSEASGQPVAVLFIDLDRFKRVNDSLGHQTGDALLRLVAERLRLSVRETDTVSRFGGDEFVVVLNGVKGCDEASEIAVRLMDSLRAPCVVDKHDLTVSCSVGIAMFPIDATCVGELMRNADAAM